MFSSSEVSRRLGEPLTRLLLLFGCGLAVSLIVWWPMLAAHPHTPNLDGHYSLMMIEVARAPVLRYHELPLWNPFDCRGVPNWDHPENFTASPLFFLTLPLSGLGQYYAFILFHAAVGFVGTWILARDDIKLSRTASFVAAAAFTLTASQTFQIAGGHLTFVTFWCFPLLLFFWRRAATDLRFAIAVGFVLGWMILHGATYPTPFCALALVLEGLTRIRTLRDLLMIVRGGVLTGVTAVGVSAVRLLPLVDQFRAHVRPNPHPDVDAITIENVWAMLTLRSLEWSSHLPGQQYVWNEYVAYTGIAGVIVIVIGMLVALRVPSTRWLVALTLLVFIVMIGHIADWSPWSLLNHHVFPYTSMRVPARFRLVLAAPLALFLGIAAEEGPKTLFRLTGSKNIARGGAALLIGVALISVGDAAGFGITKVQSHFVGAPPVPLADLPRSERFYYGGPNITPDFIDLPRQNRGWLSCRSYEWVYHQSAALWVGDEPQAKAENGDAVVTVANRTHNTFTIDVDVNAPTARILLNSAYDMSWRSSVGDVVEANHLLAIDVPQGHHRIFAEYRPKKLALGAVVSILTLAGAIAFLVVVTRRRQRD